MLNTILLQDQSAAGSGWGSIIMIVALIAIFYFFMIRPQSQRQKKINEFRKGLTKGDHVMTAGGIYGRIKEVKDNHIVLQVADNVSIKVDKNMVYQSVSDITETGANPQGEIEGRK